MQKFAQATIDDRLKAQQQLADAAYGAGVRWPTKLDKKYRQTQEHLSRLSEERFDREYMNATIDQHRDVERMLAARADESSDGAPLAAKVRRWAAMTLPEIRDHIAEAEQVYGQLETAE